MVVMSEASAESLAMHLSDQFRSRVGTTRPDALAAWDAAARGVLAHGAQVGPDLTRCLAADPDFALGHALRGLTLLIAGRAELVPCAREAAARVMRLRASRGLDRREAAYAAALSSWLDGRPSTAAQTLDVWTHFAPDDVLGVKLSHQIRFMAGDTQGMRRAAEVALAALAPDHPARGFVLGCAAFAREEMGEFDAAERAGRAAVERTPDDVWAIHAVAHVHEMTGRAADGQRWLEQHRESWIGCGNFRLHLSWHLALFELEHSRHDQALMLYDQAIRAEPTDDFRDVANAVSLLARLELDGVGVGKRWQELADLAARRIGDDAVVFARLHYLQALLAGGRAEDAAALIASLRQAAIRSGGEMDRVARHPGLAIAQGMRAFNLGRYEDAAALLIAAWRRLASLGGSVAQRDVFARFAIEAALRGGLHAMARDLIESRQRLRAGTTDRFAATRLARLDAAAPVGANAAA